jgi:biopolymer transport protein ExbD
MAGVETSTKSHARRSVDQQINMVPFVDLLMVTISFLLVTAVWTSMGRLDAHATGPGQKGEPTSKPETVLRVAATDSQIKLEWQTGTKVEDVATLVGDDARNVHALEAAVAKAAHTRDARQAILTVPNGLTTGEIVRLLDAIGAVKKDCPDGKGTCPAFLVTFSAT